MTTDHDNRLLAATLYPRLLGASWYSLADVVRRHHFDGTILRARGCFQIRRGESWFARLLGWLVGLPAEAEAVETELVISGDGAGEDWRRTFGNQLIATKQELAAGAHLLERYGVFELRFRLEVVAGGLVYHQTGAALRVGRMRLPLPRWLAPQVAAGERAGDQPGTVHVSVDVAVPLAGALISYDGTIAREEAGP